MSIIPITVAATLQADGMTLQLKEKLSLPAGPVTVTVQATGLRTGPTMVDVLDRIHRDQQKAGHKPMNEEDMAAEIADMRAEDDEYEERWKQIWSKISAKGQETDAS